MTRLQATNTDKCPNCDEPRTGRWCARCGQDNRRDRLRLPDALADLASVLFGFEGRVSKTIRGLTTNPGRVARDYIEGRRASYMHPLRYMFVTCALWWGVIGIIMANSDLSGANETQLSVMRHGSLLNLLIVPALALPFWLAFAGSKRTLLETYYTLCFCTGHMFLWRAGLSALGVLFPPGWAPTINRCDVTAAVLFTAWTFWDAYRGRVTWLPVRIVAVCAAFVYGSELLVVAAITIFLH